MFEENPRLHILSKLLGYGRKQTGELSGGLNVGTAVTTAEDDRRIYESPDKVRQIAENRWRVSKFLKLQG